MKLIFKKDKSTVRQLIKFGATAIFVLLLSGSALALSPESSSSGSGMFSEGSTKLWLLTGMLCFQIILLYTVAGIVKNLSGNRSLWRKMLNKKAGAGIIALLLMLSGSPAYAGSMGWDKFGTFISSGGLEDLLIALNTFTFAVIVSLLFVLKSLLKTLNKVHAQEQEVRTEDFWSQFMTKMTDAVPIEQEEEVMTDHEYDGIIELDNNLPPWWVLGFYITIGCAVFYIGYYHFYQDGNIMENQFVAEMEQAEVDKAAYLAKMGNMIDESNVVLLTAGLDKGKEIFIQNCASCHGAAGEGGIGPNLTDKYWLHGGGIKEVFSTVKYGVIEKGMISWKDQLTPPDMQQVSSYILSLQGTNPPNGKEPQGEEWIDKTEEELLPQDTLIQTDSTDIVAALQ